MKSINITVNEEGQIEIEAVGFKGASCQQATDAMIKALGLPTKEIKKPEFFQEDKQQVRQ
jgi:hypothetical protein